MQNSNKYYTGIGSRQTPSHIGYLMSRVGWHLAEKGYILRSGAADGADSFFEEGIGDEYPKEIYIPWKGFNGSQSELYFGNIGNEDEAEKIAKRIHPAFGKLTQGAKKLHTRNVWQLFGRDLDSESSFVIAWTPNGESKGGTRTVIELAKERSIPVYNLYDTEMCYKMMKKINQKRLYYSGDIESLNDNEVFVFGANTEWRHGAGAAKKAKEFGARYGVGPITEQTYGLITKNLTPGFTDSNGKVYKKAGERSISKADICANIKELYNHAEQNLDKWFIVAYKLDSRNLNGYTGSEMISFFECCPAPVNIVFHESFR